MSQVLLYEELEKVFKTFLLADITTELSLALELQAFQTPKSFSFWFSVLSFMKLTLAAHKVNRLLLDEIYTAPLEISIWLNGINFILLNGFISDPITAFPHEQAWQVVDLNSHRLSPNPYKRK